MNGVDGVTDGPVELRPLSVAQAVAGEGLDAGDELGPGLWEDDPDMEIYICINIFLGFSFKGIFH